LVLLSCLMNPVLLINYATLLALVSKVLELIHKEIRSPEKLLVLAEEQRVDVVRTIWEG